MKHTTAGPVQEFHNCTSPSPGSVPRLQVSPTWGAVPRAPHGARRVRWAGAGRLHAQPCPTAEEDRSLRSGSAWHTVVLHDALTLTAQTPASAGHVLPPEQPHSEGTSAQVAWLCRADRAHTGDSREEGRVTLPCSVSLPFRPGGTCKRLFSSVQKTHCLPNGEKCGCLEERGSIHVSSTGREPAPWQRTSRQPLNALPRRTGFAEKPAGDRVLRASCLRTRRWKLGTAIR